MADNTPNTSETPKQLLDLYYDGDAGLAEALDHASETIRVWRYQGKTPPHIKLGKKILYPKKDVEAWLQAQVVESKS